MTPKFLRLAKANKESAPHLIRSEEDSRTAARATHTNGSSQESRFRFTNIKLFQSISSNSQVARVSTRTIAVTLSFRVLNSQKRSGML